MHALTDAEFAQLVDQPSPARAESLPPVGSRMPLDAVRYVAFEGGGGKGVAFIGALQALQALRRLQFTADGRLDANGPIKGVSGASAGAITATLLSCGYKPEEMMAIMNAYNFNRFWDLPHYAGRQSVVRSGCQRSRNTQILGRVLRDYTSASTAATVAILLGPLASRYGRQHIEEAVNRWYSDARIERIGIRTRVEAAAGPLQKLLSAPLLYLNNLISDFGLFSGCAARDFFSRLIAERAVRVARAAGQSGAQASQFRHMTFAQHLRLFRIRLALTGANVETGKSEVFSADTTPNFPVADAARISMSLPILFKPVIIRNTRNISAQGAGRRAIPDNRLRGVWVDGGTLNNLPLRAFDDQPGSNPKTFGVRLDEEPDTADRIDDFLEYLSGVVSTLLVSGEAHITESSGIAGQTVALNTSGLKTTDFNPSAQIRDARIREAKAETRRYFTEQ